jgi:type III restriction enzyme
LKSGAHLVLETKGQDTDQDKTKRAFLDEWIKGVNEHGGFGKWSWAVSRQPGDLIEILRPT